MSKKQESQAASRAAKRARFTEQQSKSAGASPAVLAIGLVIMAALVGGVIFALTRPGTTAADAPALEAYRIGSQGLQVKAATLGHDPYPLVEAENGVVQFALTTFDDYQAHYYTFMHQGRPIEFFVLKSRDGVVRAAFNACDVCFAAKKGYYQDGDYMVCGNCGSRFPADQINVVRGGCNPSPLDRTVEGDTLTIQVQDIVQGLEYF